MASIYVRVKGIIEKDGKYLLVKHWVDDRIPDPFIWEFIETNCEFGEAPQEAVIRGMDEVLSIECQVKKTLYTWSHVIGDSQCVGITFLCSLEEEEELIKLSEEYGEWKWVDKKEFSNYIENPHILRDLEKWV